MEYFTMFIRDGCHVFGKNPKRSLEMTIQWHVTPHRTVSDPAQFYCNFPLFRCLESSCRKVQMPPRPFFLYNLILYYVLVFEYLCNLCTNENPFFLLGLIYFGKFLPLKIQTLLFIYPPHSHIFLSNRALYAAEANRICTYPLKQDVPRSSNLVLFLNWVAIFFAFCSGSPSLTCPIRITRSRI